MHKFSEKLWRNHKNIMNLTLNRWEGDTMRSFQNAHFGAGFYFLLLAGSREWT